jgi:glycosyltransferase involved in cell wall biosynthesis
VLTENQKAVKVLVVQNGARHNYAVPTVLENAGLLERFYTDALGNVGLGRWLARGRGLPGVGPALERLGNRRVSDAVAAKTTSFVFSSALDLRLGGDFVGREMERQGFGDATLIYSSLGWGRTFLKEARRKRIPIVVEFYVRPSLWKIYQSEFRAFPGWEEELPCRDMEGAIGSQRDPCTVADFVIVPAEGVAEDVADQHNFPREKILVIPYAVGNTFFEIQNQPLPGRVFFAGSASLGKGIHYLAMAAERLAPGNRYDFRVAGNVQSLVAQQPICRHLNFLGRVPRAAIGHEFAQADVFVLPTLSEGSAGATYEALAAGIPVITTRAAGSVVRDGIEGRLVPERDADALAEAIRHVVEDRELRDRMGLAARERARDFTLEKYGERLVKALHSMA